MRKRSRRRRRQVGPTELGSQSDVLIEKSKRIKLLNKPNWRRSY